MHRVRAKGWVQTMTRDKNLIETTAHGHGQRERRETQSRIAYYMGGTRCLLYGGDETVNPLMQGVDEVEDRKHEHDNALLALYVAIAEGESLAVKDHEHDHDGEI